MTSDMPNSKHVVSTINGADIASLFEEHSDYLYRYALFHFKNPEQARDLVQDTFVAVARSHNTFKGQSSIRTWLTTILKHKLIDHIRRKSTTSEVSLDDLAERGLEHFFDSRGHWTNAGPQEWGRDPEQTAERNEFLSILNSCLGKLPERFRQIFLLKEWDGLSRDQISAELGLTANNVGVMLHRARVSLRECVGLNWGSQGGSR
jgi:RNA polymerase sigma-70 factor (ECF subfamily)